MPKRDAATKKLVPLFEHMYEDMYQQKYLLNWPLIKNAEKVAEHYSTNEMKGVLQYYFDHYSNHNLWDFISTIDKVYDNFIKENESLTKLKQLIDNTSNKLEEYESGKSINNENPNDEEPQ